MTAKDQFLRSVAFALMTVFCWLPIGALSLSAQAAPTPITIGANQTGELADGPAAYSLSVDSAQSVHVVVLAISQGFVPTLRVIDPDGIVVVDIANGEAQTAAQATVNLSSPGSYTIHVGSVRSVPGQFAIAIQPGQPLEAPVPLLVGQRLADAVDSQTTRRAYSFSASENDILLLTVGSDDPSAGMVVALRDAETGETLSLTNARIAGMHYRILTGQTNYLLEVTYPGGAERKSFAVCLETENASTGCAGSAAADVTAEAIEPTVAATTIAPSATCAVSSVGPSVNVRSGPATAFGVVGTLPPGVDAPVVGRLANNAWFQINLNGMIGWVSASVVTAVGDCAGVDVVAAPAPPAALPAPPAPTSAPAQPTTAPNPPSPTSKPTDEPPPPTATATNIPPTFSGTGLHVNPNINASLVPAGGLSR